MFLGFNPAGRTRPPLAPAISSLLHCLLLLWLVHSPRPIFVAPSSVARGEGGTRVTPLYYPVSPLASAPADPSLSAPVSARRKDSRSRLQWPQSSKSRGGPNLSPSTVVQSAAAKDANSGPSAGSPSGSQGPLSGEEIRPALPINASDPAVYPWELREEGDVIIEITIDEAGNITDKRVLHSMTPAIDQKVLLALETWRFRPATRDGIPIPSKQDVHYHFKPS